MSGLRFRPLPGLTIFMLVMTALLIWLGIWQLQRLKWKEALIATVSGHMLAAPISLDEAQRLSADEAQYRRVALRGHFDNSKEAYVFTTGAGRRSGLSCADAFITDDGVTLMVDRGEIPREKLPPQSRVAMAGETHVVGVWRVPDAPGFFTPKPDPAKTCLVCARPGRHCGSRRRETGRSRGD